MDLKTKVKPRFLKHKDLQVWSLTNLKNESILYGHIDGIGLDVVSTLS